MFPYVSLPVYERETFTAPGVTVHFVLSNALRDAQKLCNMHNFVR